MRNRALAAIGVAVAVGCRLRPVPVRAETERPAFNHRRRRARVRVDLQRGLARGVGRGPDVLAGAGRRARRRDHAGDRRQEQHVRDLARRPAGGLRAQARLPDHRRRQQRHQLSQRQRAGPGDPGQQVRLEGLSVRHRRRQAIRRQQLRGKGAAVPGGPRPGRRTSSAGGRRSSFRRSTRTRVWQRWRQTAGTASI